MWIQQRLSRRGQQFQEKVMTWQTKRRMRAIIISMTRIIPMLTDNLKRTNREKWPIILAERALISCNKICLQTWKDRKLHPEYILKEIPRL